MNNFLKSIIGLVAIFVLSSQTIVKDKLKIVAFGDSITARRSTVDSVFAQRLPGLLADRGVACEMIISGTGSSHSGKLTDNDFAKVKHGLDRFQTDVLDHKPDVVIIGFGANDAYIDGDDPNGKSRISLSKYKENLVFMIETLQANGVFVILRTPPPFSFSEERMYLDKRLYGYVKVVRRLAKQYQTGLSDDYKLFKGYKGEDGGYGKLLPDGVHPNDLGHEMIANNVANVIVKYVKNGG